MKFVLTRWKLIKIMFICSFLRQCFGASGKMYNLHAAHLYDYLERTNYKAGQRIPSLKKMGMPSVADFKKQCIGDGDVAYLYLVDAFATNEAKQHFNKAIAAYNKAAYQKQCKKTTLKRQKSWGIMPTFRDLKGMPKFKSRKNAKASYTTFNLDGNVYLEGNALYLPTARKSPRTPKVSFMCPLVWSFFMMCLEPAHQNQSWGFT